MSCWRKKMMLMKMSELLFNSFHVYSSSLAYVLFASSSSTRCFIVRDIAWKTSKWYLFYDFIFILQRWYCKFNMNQIILSDLLINFICYKVIGSFRGLLRKNWILRFIKIKDNDDIFSSFVILDVFYCPLIWEITSSSND